MKHEYLISFIYEQCFVQWIILRGISMVLLTVSSVRFVMSKTWIQSFFVVKGYSISFFFCSSKLESKWFKTFIFLLVKRKLNKLQTESNSLFYKEIVIEIDCSTIVFFSMLLCVKFLFLWETKTMKFSVM